MNSNFVEKYLWKLLRKADPAYHLVKTSWSQCGEDLIVDFLLTWVLGIKCPSYLDIGAHHSHHFNNTYIFYKRGLTGVNIEPDPQLFNNLVKYRPFDINVNKGVGFKKNNEDADFYIMSSRALNTFSKEEAERVSKSGNVKIDKIIQVELININDVLSSYFSEKGLDYLTIDVEGYDLAILKSLDFENHCPKVICVETASFTEELIVKQQGTIDFIISKGFVVYADTSINTIFVRKSLLA